MLRLALLSCLFAAAYVSADVTCLNPGQTATARFVNGAGETCTWTGTVGVNFGINPKNGRRWDTEVSISTLFSNIHMILHSRYDCNGRYLYNSLGAPLRSLLKIAISFVWLNDDLDAAQAVVVSQSTISGKSHILHDATENWKHKLTRTRTCTSRTQDCFSHDICSWFYGATGGAGYHFLLSFPPSSSLPSRLFFLIKHWIPSD